MSFALDETNLPADIPSYLSSQGTLADRQDGYIPSESGSSHQYMTSSISGFYLQPKEMIGKKLPFLLCFLSESCRNSRVSYSSPFICPDRSLSFGYRN